MSVSAYAEDKRVYQHGIEAVQEPDGSAWVFFSSSGLPPKGSDSDGGWTHDVYVAHWNKNTKKLKPRLFIRKPEAQEPASVARTTDGHIMLTFEDGWDADGGVNQRYGIYNDALKPVKPYPQLIEKGGHSGHVAAVGNNFVVFYSDGWIKGGGIDNLGSGDGVYVKTYDSNGNLLHDSDIIDGKREWWPMVAGSSQRALLLWQQFVPDETYARLRMSLLDSATGDFTSPVTLHDNLRYYTYRVAYIPAVERFIITGTTDNNRGFAYLVNDAGDITAQLDCMPPIVREGGIAVDGTLVTTPTADNRLLHLRVTQDSIMVAGTQPSPIIWQELGSVGLKKSAKSQHWIALGRDGQEEADFDLTKAVPVSTADICKY